MELRIDADKWRRKRGVGRLLAALSAKDGLTRYVGGAVRDELLGLPHSDFDLATMLRPEDVVQRLEAAKIRAVPTGIEHGTITAVSSGHPFEITSLRRDVSTDGRRATVAFTDDWQEDAARRDFTINALSADPQTGEVYDYFGGKEDLLARRVRFIGDPLDRIAEDHLRILRFFRFHARFGEGEPDRDALTACAERANDLMALSRERIADELLKLLAVEDPSPTVSIMLDRGILRPVLPEIEAKELSRLQALVAAESEARIRRRSAATFGEPFAAGARRSQNASPCGSSCRTRRGNASPARRNEALPDSAQKLAYFVGIECAVDRLLLVGKPGPRRASANGKRRDFLSAAEH